MRVILLGSSQTQHIKAIYESQGWICDQFSTCSNPIYRKILNLRKVMAADAIYSVFAAPFDPPYLRIARLLRKKIILHWIGTDVLNAIKCPPSKHLLKTYRRYTHLAGSPLLQAELRTIGIESTVVAIVPIGIHFSALPMPKHHEVLAYIPEAREGFYNMPLLKEIAKRFPDTIFHIVANSGGNDQDPLPNISYEGTLDQAGMRDLYKKCPVLFRYPQHDGLSMMVLEALGTGRTVIYKYEFPFVKTPANDTVEEIQKTFKKVFDTQPHLDQAAIDYMNSDFSMEKQIERYRSAGIL